MRTFKKTTIAAMVCSAFASAAGATVVSDSQFVGAGQALDKVQIVTGSNATDKPVIRVDGATGQIQVNGGLDFSGTATADKISNVAGKDFLFTGVNFAGGDFSAANNIETNLGAIVGYLKSDQGITVSNSQFSNNSVAVGAGVGVAGGALRVVGEKAGDAYSRVNVSNSKFTGNSYQTTSNNGVWGGAIALVNTATVLDGVNVSANTASAQFAATNGDNIQGVGIYQNGGTLAANNLTVSGNSAIAAQGAPLEVLAMGAGMMLWELDTVAIANSEFSGNSSKVGGNKNAQGGGAYLRGKSDGSADLIQNTRFSNNSVSTAGGFAYGGALYAQYKSTGADDLVLRDVVFTNNSATTDTETARGGAVFARNTAITFEATRDAQYTGNTVSATGGGVAQGGFLYLRKDAGYESSATFNVASNATLTIGERGKDTDSIASDAGALLNKTGAGNLVIHSSLDDFKGSISVAQGSLSASAFSLADGASTLTVGGDAARAFGGPQASVVFKNNAVNGLVTVNAGGLATIGSETSGWVSQAVSASGATFPANGATLALSGAQKLTADGGLSVGAGAAQAGNAAFGANSLLVVDAAALGSNAALTGTTGSVATVDASSKLVVANAKVGDKVTVLSGFDTSGVAGWANDNLYATNVMASSKLLDAQLNKTASSAQVTVSQVAAGSVYGQMTDSMAGVLDNMVKAGLNDVNSANAGVSFLSRATDIQYVGSDRQTVTTLEGAAQIAAIGGVAAQTLEAANIGAGAVTARTSLTAPAVKGTGLWATPLYQRSSVSGMQSGAFETGYDSHLTGIAFGADLAANASTRAGVALNVGTGSVESTGDFGRTDNDVDFWGVNAYAGWTAGNLGLSADVGYASTSNELSQGTAASLGFGSLKADADAAAWTLGVRGEVRLPIDGLDVVAGAGLRYASIKTDAHRVTGNGGTVFNVAADTQNLWTFPVGVSVSKAFVADGGWNLRPQVALGVIAAAGDLDSTTRATVPGVLGTAVLGTEVVDRVAFDGGLGIDAVKGNLSLGLKYGVQASSNRTAQGVYASVRYMF